MKKTTYITGNFVEKDGHVIFVECPDGFVVVNSETLLPKRQRPWLVRKIHTLLWNSKETIQYHTPKPPMGTIPVEEFQEMWKRAEIPGAWKSRLYRQFTPDYSFWGNIKGKFRYFISTIKMKLSGWKITRQ